MSIDLYSPICMIIFPERHHTISEQDICQTNEIPRVKTKVQINTKKSKIPKLLGRLYCLKLQVLRKKLFLNCSINIYKRWYFFIWCSSETFAEVSKQQPASFASSSTKKTKGAVTRDGKKKTLKSWLRVMKYFKSKFYSLQHVWKRCRLAGSHPQPNKCTSPAGMTQTRAPDTSGGNRSGELMQHSRLRAWAKLFALRLLFQSQSVFKLLVL